ncbi:cell shape-determining protein MreB [Polymorphospora lycopeni]|uniref:Cell shape-determining protein MreB n=1 Tax=Polymorphospora lycopeni TaxID=3140240 RepID=A0ABV5CVB3_9ACTN
MTTHLGTRRPAAARRSAPHGPAAAVMTSPTPVAVDLGSAYLTLWAGERGVTAAPTNEGRTPLIRRARIIDGPGSVALLSRLLLDYHDPVPAGAVVVACRPVLATPADQQLTRRVLTQVFAPSRLLFIDTLRAAAIGAGAATGRLLIADIGAELTEVAMLDGGHVVAARRADLGTRDLARGAGVDMLADTVVRALRDVCQQADTHRFASRALTRGLVLVGDGATRPDLTTQLVSRLRTSVHPAAAPHTVALTGASLAAMAAMRHPTAG